MEFLQTTYHVQCTCREGKDGDLVSMHVTHCIESVAEVLVCPACKAKVVFSVRTNVDHR